MPKDKKDKTKKTINFELPKGKKIDEQLAEKAIAAQLNPDQINADGEPAKKEELEKIIKTTDSMNIISAMQNAGGPKERKIGELDGVRDAIFRSYDLARRKITTEYERIVVSTNYIDSPFLAIQLVLKNSDKKWNVQLVEQVIQKFSDAIIERVALGKTVFLSQDLVIEPISYVSKILPSWKITPNFAALSNGVKWEDIIERLVEKGELSHNAKEIVAELIKAIETNVSNGYHVKISRFIILQLSLESVQKIILFSNDTLTKINDIYTRFLKTGEKQQINKYDAVVSFDKTLEYVEKGFFAQDVRDALEQEPDFVPEDIKEIEKTSVVELDKDENAQANATAQHTIGKVETIEEIRERERLADLANRAIVEKAASKADKAEAKAETPTATDAAAATPAPATDDKVAKAEAAAKAKADKKAEADAAKAAKAEAAAKAKADKAEAAAKAKADKATAKPEE